MPSFTIGLDLGQSRDPSVLAVVERVEMRRPDAGDYGRPYDDHFYVRHLQRFETGTSYTAIVRQVGQVMSADALRGCAVLRFDATGVGRGIADMFKDAYNDGQLGDCWPHAVTLHGGRESTGLSVAKVDLVGQLQRVLQERRLHVPENLPGASKLRQELTDYTAKITAAGRDSFEAATEAAHDDHVIAVGLALHRSAIGIPRLLDADGQLVDAAVPGW